MDEILALPAAPQPTRAPPPPGPGGVVGRATYHVVRAEVQRVAHVTDIDVDKVHTACHEAWETCYLYNHMADPKEDKDGSWCHFLTQELNNKSVFENLLLATLLYSRQDRASEALLGQGVLDLCVHAIVKYRDDPGIVELASNVIDNIAPRIPPVCLSSSPFS